LWRIDKGECILKFIAKKEQASYISEDLLERAEKSDRSVTQNLAAIWSFSALL
jgi:hypothetical protein